MKAYTIRKGLYVKALGQIQRVYQVIKTTRRKAHLKARDTGKVFVMERKKVFTLTTPIGHKLAAV